MSLTTHLKSALGRADEPTDDATVDSIYPTVVIDGIALTVHAYRFGRQTNPVQPAETLYLDAELHGMRDEHRITNPDTIESVVEQLEEELDREISATY